MSLTNGEVIAFTILLAPLAVAFGMTLYATWLVYSTRRMLGVPRLRDTSRTFVHSHPRGFVTLTFAYILLAMGLIITFAVFSDLGEEGALADSPWLSGGPVWHVEGGKLIQPPFQNA